MYFILPVILVTLIEIIGRAFVEHETSHSIPAHNIRREAVSIEWNGDLDDDCAAKWSGLLLRAEWMNEDRWWWAVSDIASGQEIDSSNNDGYFDMTFRSGHAARQAAERSANDHLQRLTHKHREA